MISIPCFNWSHIFTGNNSKYEYWKNQLNMIIPKELVEIVAKQLKNVNFEDLLTKEHNITMTMLLKNLKKLSIS